MKRLLFILLAALMIVSATVTANAATTTKVEKSYEIAVVFDNSGSMYNNEGWCRAKYAMEIFASMLDYSGGDKLKIYPMWEVTTDGSQPATGGSYAAIEIKNKSDIDKITNLFTVHPSNTPFEPITEAYEDLRKSQASEKWLIVLTDGVFNEEKRGQSVGEIDPQTLTQKLEALATNGIKVQYLGFGSASELKSNEQKGFYAKSSNDVSLKDDLVGICNSIFQRSVLTDNRINGHKIELDLSMKNLIVFAQGDDGKIVSLTDENGKEIGITMDSGQRKYSTIKANRHLDAPVDTTLAGQVMTFGACAKGTYKLNYSGKIQIFYEPDVDIKVTLKNSDGVEIDPTSGELAAGEYTIESAIVDSVTGEDVTSHALMGSSVTLNTYVKPSGASQYTRYSNGAKITFEPDSETEIYVEGKYLGEYTISTKDDPGALSFKWNFVIPGADFKINASVSQADGEYVLQDHDNWLPIKVSMTIEGAPLTADEMARTELSVTGTNGIEYRYESVPGESAYYIYVGSDQNGQYAEPKAGEYKLDITGTYTGKYNEKNISSDGVSFTIVDKAAEFKLDAEVLQSQNWYNLRRLDEWDPVKVKLTLNGQPLTEEEMAKTSITVTSSRDLTYWYEAIPGESAYYIYVAHDSAGNFAEPEKGRYTLEISGVYTDEYGIEYQQTDKASFDIQNYSKIWLWLFWLVLVAAIAAIIFVIMSRKVLPKDMDAEQITFMFRHRSITGSTVDYDRRGKSLDIRSPSVPNDMNAECKASFRLYAVDRRWTPSKRRKFGISNISNVSMGVTRIMIDGTPFVKNKTTGVFESQFDPGAEIHEETSNPMIRIEAHGSKLDCTIEQK